MRLLHRDRLRRVRRADGGFSLVEVMVAMFVFLLLMTAVLATFDTATSATRNNRLRVLAANLAARQIETARGQDVFAVQSGGYDFSVDGTAFHLEQTAELVPESASSSTCDAPSGSRLAYKRVTVIVTWPNMRGVTPVRSDTLKTLPITGLDPSKGSLAVKVEDRNGTPVGSQTVNIEQANQTLSTGIDGCVVFVGLPPNSGYSAALNTPGWVDPTGSQATVVSPLTITAAALTKAPVVRYDRAATMTLSYDGPAGYTVPAGIERVLSSDPSLPSQTKNYGACSTTTVTVPASCATSIGSLYPWVNGYVAWAGSCPGNRPATLPSATTTNPGGSSSATLGVAGVQVQVRSAATGALVSGQPLYATPDPAVGCPAGTSYPLGSSAADPLRVALPYGTYLLGTSTASSPPSGQAWPRVTLSSSTATPPLVEVTVP